MLPASFRIAPAINLAALAFTESGGKVYEIDVLRTRTPDLRAAISAAITKRAETVLPDPQIAMISKNWYFSWRYTRSRQANRE